VAELSLAVDVVEVHGESPQEHWHRASRVNQEVNTIKALHLVEASLEGLPDEADVQCALLGAGHFSTHTGDDDRAAPGFQGDAQGGGDGRADKAWGSAVVELGDYRDLKLAFTTLGNQCVEAETRI